MIRRTTFSETATGVVASPGASCAARTGPPSPDRSFAQMLKDP